MLKNTGEYVYIKDYKAPKSIKVTMSVEGDSDFRFTAKGGTTVVDFSPISYIEATGSLKEDFKQYAANVISHIIKGLFFDNGNDAEKSYNDVLSRKQAQELDGELELLKLLVDNPKAIFDDVELVSKLKVFNGVFGHFEVNLRAVEAEFEGISNLFRTDLECFRYMFCQNGYGTNLISRDVRSDWKLCMKDRYSSYILRDIIDMLAKLFAYYISKTRRMEYTAAVAEKVYTFVNEISEVLLWDDSLEKYMYYSPHHGNKFTVSDVAPGITVKHNMTEKYPELHNRLKENGGERYNNVERVKLLYAKGCSDDVIVTMRNKIIGQNNKEAYTIVNSYMAYKGHSAPQSDTKDFAVSIDLFTEFEDETDSIIANRIIYDKVPLHAILADEAKYCFESFEDIRYNIDRKVTFKCNVCYFSKGGGVTFKSYKDLQSAKIPKDKRDHIFDALCVLCYELGLEPSVVFDRLKVDFLRYYKEPVSLYDR